MDVNAFAMSLRDLDSSTLLERFGAAVRRDHHETAGLVCYIAEIDRRELWAEQGFSSLFNFCVEKFNMSEGQAGRRIHTARTMRKYPLVGEMIAKGELHLTGVCLLARHLTEDNHRDVLGRARHRSADEIKKLVAELHPKPDVPSRVTKLRRRSEMDGTETPSEMSGSLFPSNGATETASEAGGPKPSNSARAPEAIDCKRWLPRVEPLSPQRYKLQLTMSEATHAKLEQVKALLWHRVPSGDPAILFDMALDALLERARKERTGATSQPRSAPSNARSSDATRTRHVPAAVRRAVWKRDRGQCAYVSPDGRRCIETRGLELHHREPYARGGAHTVDNTELRCRPHNQYQANRDYGRAFMEGRRRRSGAREGRAAYVRAPPSYVPGPRRAATRPTGGMLPPGTGLLNFAPASSGARPYPAAPRELA